MRKQLEGNSIWQNKRGFVPFWWELALKHFF